MKIDLTKSAIDELKGLEMEDSDIIRIAIAGQSCSGPQFAFTLGEEGPGDERFDIEGLSFLVDEEIRNLVDGFEIDFVNDERGKGFLLIPIGMESSCGSCSCH